MANSEITNMVSDPLKFEASSLVDDGLDGVPGEDLDSGDNDGIEAVEEAGEPEEEDDGIEPISEEEEASDQNSLGENPLALSEDAKKGMSPEAIKRYEQHVAGIQKVEAKLKEREDNLGANEKRNAAFESWDRGLSQKESALETFAQMGKVLQEAHQFSPAQISALFGKATAEPAKGSDDEFEAEYDSDRKVAEYARAQAAKAEANAVKLAVQQAIASLGFDPKEAAALITANKSSTAAKENEAKAEALAPRVAKTLRIQDGGWSPDPAKVKAVIAQHPGLLGTPSKLLDVVRIAMREDRDKHLAGTRPDAPGPEGLKTGQASGKALPKNPLEVTAAQLLGLE